MRTDKKNRLLALAPLSLLLAGSLAFLLSGPPALAQFTPSQTVKVSGAPLALDYDPGTSYTYCKYTGQGGLVFSPAFVQTKRIVTVGSSVTTASNTAGELAFAALSVGDYLEVRLPAGTNQTSVLDRYVATDPDGGETITVNSAWDLSTPTGGFPFTYRLLACGTGAEDGWFGVSQFELVRFNVLIDQLNAASADIIVQCRDQEAVATPMALVTKSYTAVGGDGILVSAMLYDQCRLGMKVTTDAGAQKFTVTLRGI